MNYDSQGNLVLHCLHPGCKRESYPWCEGHDLREFRRNARQVFGWSLKK